MVAPMDPVMKNLGRSKFFACFNPVGDDDGPCCHSPSPYPDGESGRRRKTAHHGFSGSLKAVFFRTPLVKKFRSKRWRRDSCRSSSNSSSKTKKQTNTTKKQSSYKGFSDEEEIFDRRSLFSTTPSSSASSITSDSRSGSERIKGSASLDLRQTRYEPAAGMYVLLVCLVTLVFWGKAFAIVTCTSTWLFFAPSRRSQGGGSPVYNNDVDSEEYRKRVIMDGLLQRNRR